jgi:hypothetical protein
MQLQPGMRLADGTQCITKIAQDIKAHLDDRWIDSGLREIPSSSGLERCIDYFQWCLNYERELRRVFSDSEPIEMIHSPRYWNLQGAAFQQWTAAVIEMELHAMLERLESAISRLKLFEPLEHRTGYPMMLDTSVWIGYGPLHDKQERGDGKEVAQADWCQITGASGGTDFWLVIPVVTLDELDGVRTFVTRGSPTVHGRRVTRSAHS